MMAVLQDGHTVMQLSEKAKNGVLLRLMTYPPKERFRSMIQ